LEIFYNNKPDIKHLHFLDRKIRLYTKSILLYGVNNSGKSYLIYDYLNFLNKDYLYIDFNDLRLNKNKITKDKLKEFIKNIILIY
jgi:predicted AAA+ superfamily ATPase